MKYLFCICIVCCTLFLVPSADAKPRHVRVIWGANPESRALVSFSSSDPTATVHFDYESGGAKIANYAQTRASASKASYRGSGVIYHHVPLEDLRASSKIYFTISADGEQTREYYFVTAPSDDRPFRIVYGGDSRTQVATRQQVNQLIAELTENDPGLIAFAHGGDYISVGELWSQWDQWLHDHELTVARDGRILPIIPARGNHEFDGFIYNQVFGFPGGTTGDYWVTTIGSDLVWITLDTNSSLAGDQRIFLERELIKAQSHRWITANYHRPAFPAVKTIGAAYEHFVPLFEKYNVDFVCESDGHVLKRTVPIRNGMMDPTGVVYIGEGGLGVSQRTPDVSRWYLKPPGMAASAHHVQVLSFSPERVAYRAIGLDRATIDDYVFYPKREGKVKAPDVTRAELDVGRRIVFQLTEPVKTMTINAPGHVEIPSGQLIETMNFDESSQQLTVDLAPDSSLPVQVILRGMEDLSGQVIDELTFNFSGPKFPVVGKLVERKPIERLAIAPIKVKPKTTPAPKPTAARCSVVGQETTFGGVMLCFALFLFRRRKK